MTTTYHSAASAGLNRAIGDLRESALKALRLGKASAGTDLVRVAVPLESVDPLAWLASQTVWPQSFWQDREGVRTVAAIGEADCIRLDDGQEPSLAASTASLRLARSEGEVRYFGGFRFDRLAGNSGDWRPFGAGWLRLHRFECVRDDSGVTLACCLNLQRDTESELTAQFNQLSDEIESLELPMVPPTGRRDLPDLVGWRQGVRSALQLIASTELEKVVLARQVRLEFDREFSYHSLLARLRSASKRSYVFAISPQPGTAFVGVSPERLYSRDRRQISSEALAGTRPRGTSDEADAGFGRSLRNSLKDTREHGVVRNHVRSQLTPLTDRLETDADVSLVKLSAVQHLIIRMRGTLKAGIDDAALLDALHPTPAVAGEPRELACRHIRDTEPFDRGWYAGPVGCVGRNQTEFAVAIRSGLLYKNTVYLIAGAGIVEESDPDAELEEIEAKLRTFTNCWSNP